MKKIILIFAISFIYTIASSAQNTTQVQCGDIVEGEFTEPDTTHEYIISLSPGDNLLVSSETIGTYLNYALNIWSPTNDVVASADMGSNNNRPKSIETGILSARGNYSIRIRNVYYDYSGVYTLYIGCILRDGTIIEPGDNVSREDVTNSSSASPYSGFGFPGIGSVSFSTGIEIPLEIGESQTVPLGGDITLYTYNASSNEARTLNISRVSGNISIGVAVIESSSNEIVFFGGMPSSDNLSVELTFPSRGTYVIGLFRVDTEERSSTSGAVQILLE